MSVEPLPVAERARRYLAEMDAAQSGAGGHNATFKAACVLLHGFALSEADALRLMEEEFNPRCSPRWTAADLRHKVQSAVRARSVKPRGYLLMADDPGFVPPSKPTKEERAWRKKMRRDAEIGRRAKAGLPKLLRDYAWSVASMQKTSFACAHDPADGWRDLLSLFEPSDVIWIGDTFQSGQPCFDALFQPAAAWLRLPASPPGPLISASTFRPGAYQRSRDNVVRTPFLVVESDVLSREEIGAVFAWLCVRAGLCLRAVIDTGGKSLHGWFDQPVAGSRRDDLLVALAAMGCDRGPWREPAMSRLPGAWRDGQRRQRLLWCNPLGLPFYPV